MNFSELFIRRPVMTVLLNVAIVAAGVIGFQNIPVAALPSYDTPVISVTASLPGANPETMASSVALPLEKQFQTVPGLKVISSSSTLGTTTLTLEFEDGRDINAASIDVQAALLRAQRTLPIEMTVPPSYRSADPSFELETRAFIDLISSDTSNPILSTAEDGCAALKIVEQLYAATDTRGL